MPVVSTAENVVTTPCVADGGPLRWPDPDIVAAVLLPTTGHPERPRRSRPDPWSGKEIRHLSAGIRGWPRSLRSQYSVPLGQETAMRPCHLCGSTEIDPIGYCRHCRVFRGAEPQPEAVATGT